MKKMVEFCPVCGFISFRRDDYEHIGEAFNRHNLCPICKSSVMPIVSDSLFKVISAFNKTGVVLTGWNERVDGVWTFIFDTVSFEAVSKAFTDIKKHYMGWSQSSDIILMDKQCTMICYGDLEFLSDVLLYGIRIGIGIGIAKLPYINDNSYKVYDSHTCTFVELKGSTEHANTYYRGAGNIWTEKEYVALDAKIAGYVQWLNRRGFETKYSCGGHHHSSQLKYDLVCDSIYGKPCDLLPFISFKDPSFIYDVVLPMEDIPECIVFPISPSNNQITVEIPEELFYENEDGFMVVDIQTFEKYCDQFYQFMDRVLDENSQTKKMKEAIESEVDNHELQ